MNSEFRTVWNKHNTARIPNSEFRIPNSQRFLVLSREFFAQFFASESATSDHQVRQAIIGVLAFLITPGLVFPLQLSGAFEFAVIRFPAMLDPLIRLVATIFITYGIVAMGVIAAFTWDALGFDRRDAMVLGPTPVSGATVVAAKLAALAALLLAGATTVNVTTALSFALIAENHGGVAAVVRQFSAHMAATTTAATFVFSFLVTIRALVGLLSRGRVAIASVLQFTLVSASLCLIVLVPTALRINGGGRRGPLRVTMQSIPDWSPTNWFLGIFELTRGSSPDEFETAAVRGLLFTLIVMAAATLATIASYRRQQQLALTPSPSAGLHVAARAQLALARLLAGRDAIARGIAEFVLATMMRNRVQQAPVALNAAIGVAFVAAALSRAGGDIAALMRPRTVILWIPMVFGYWMTIGVRAAFFIPSELPASWAFRANGPASHVAYLMGTRAAMRAFLLPPLLLLSAAVTTPLLGVRIAVWHTAFVAVMLVAIIELAVLTIDALPFTHPYRPGHAKLKTRWPLYLLGMFVFAYWPVRAEMSALGGSELSLLLWPAAAALALHLAGRRVARRWSIEPEDFGDDDDSVTILAIGAVSSSRAGA
jgi:hypothetical protein